MDFRTGGADTERQGEGAWGKPSAYVSLKRKWKKGDVITLTLPAATLAFRAHDAGPADGITFRPLYDVHHQRYSAYWRIRKADSK